MAIKEKIEQSVKTAYQKYGLKEDTRKEFISMIEAEAAKREITSEQEDTFISEQIVAYEFAAKLAQKEAMSRVPTPQPASAPNPEPTPSSSPLTIEAIKELFASERKLMQDEIDSIKKAKTKEDVFASVQEKLKNEAKNSYSKSAATEAWDYVTRGISDTITDVELYDSYKTKYEKECAKINVNPYEPKDGGGGGKKEDYSDEIARLQSEGRLPKSE